MDIPAGLALWVGFFVRLEARFSAPTRAIPAAARAGAVKDALLRARKVDGSEHAARLRRVGADLLSIGSKRRQSVWAKEHAHGAIGILVHSHCGLDEVRPEPALRQLQPPIRSMRSYCRCRRFALRSRTAPRAKPRAGRQRMKSAYLSWNSPSIRSSSSSGARFGDRRPMRRSISPSSPSAS